MNKDKAIKYVIKAHQGQYRKYTNEPYSDHCIRVADIVGSVTDDLDVYYGALLHDVYEDTDITYDEIKELFGVNVANLVLEVTNVGNVSLPRKERKKQEVEHLSHASKNGKTIKLADILDKLPSVIEYDRVFAVTYVYEKWMVFNVIREGNSDIALAVATLISNYYKMVVDEVKQEI